MHFFGASKRPLAENLTSAILEGAEIGNFFVANLVNFSELKPKFYSKMAGNLT